MADAYPNSQTSPDEECSIVDFETLTCSQHKTRQVPSFCIKHGLLVFCCPTCFDLDHKPIEQSDNEKEEKGKPSCITITYTNLPGGEKLTTLINNVEEQTNYAIADNKACTEIINYFDKHGQKEISPPCDINRHFTRRSGLIQDHITQLQQLSTFLSLADNKSESLEGGITRRCNDSKCRTCNTIDGSSVLTNKHGKSFVIPKSEHSCMSNHVVYAMTCKQRDCSGLIYIGQTKERLRSRMSGHRAGNQQLVYNHFKKHDKDMNVCVIQSDINDEKILDELERRMIKEMGTLSDKKLNYAPNVGWNKEEISNEPFLDLRKHIREEYDTIKKDFGNRLTANNVDELSEVLKGLIEYRECFERHVDGLESIADHLPENDQQENDKTELQKVIDGIIEQYASSENHVGALKQIIGRMSVGGMDEDTRNILNKIVNLHKNTIEDPMSAININSYLV